MKKQKLGLDFGKVIIGAVQNGREDTSFLGTTFEEAMTTPPSHHAFDATRQLVDRFSGNVWIVSKCGPSVETKTKGWLKHWRLCQETGLDRAKVRFCRERRDKAKVCKQLGITHFVDDRLDVLEPMIGIVPNLFLFGEQSADTVCPDWATPVADWFAVLENVVTR